MNLTKEIVGKLLKYDPNTGIFYFKKRDASWFKSTRAMNAWNARFAGKQTGCIDSKGYVQIKLHGEKHLAHRLAVLLTFDILPEVVDHINGNKKDNRISNLRPATKSQNSANRTESGGVYKTSSGKFRAQGCIDYHIFHLGTYDNYDLALQARKNFMQSAFGEFSPY